MLTLGKARKAKRHLAAADRARDRRDWHEAAALYRRVVTLKPSWAGIWIQHGHALKEGGRADEAEASYREALERDGGSADARLQLGHLLKLQGRLPEAVACYAGALRIAPELDAARAELMHLGARDALPEFGGSGLRRAVRMAEIGRLGGKLEASLIRLTGDLTAPSQDYAAFRAEYPLPPPPSWIDDRIDIVVDARRSTPAQLRATLLSLLDQTVAEWSATIVAPDLLDHPVASLGVADRRLRLMPDWPRVRGTGRPYILFAPAGAVLEPHALRWLSHPLVEREPVAVYADHDAVRPDWRLGAERGAPCFYPMFDRIFMSACDEPPLLVLVHHAVLEGLDVAAATEDVRRKALLAAGARGAVVHLPRILSSVVMMPPSVMEGEDDLPVPLPTPSRHTAARGSDGTRLNIVIPTRDMPDLLSTCVDSLRARAARPDRLAITIVDNRSREQATSALLDGWEGSGVARRIACDEPFNWSRANNLAVEGLADGHLCFVNNDTEMLTEGWDDIVAEVLADPTVGAVGARLLYPDRTIQHAGVLFGIGRGSPIHEGVGAAASESGPLDRWRTRRQVPAVTGAFLCCRRAAFDATGGFDAVHLPIGFNDIDFCMKLRVLGLAILYEPAIELVHLESKTRGANRTITQREWDHAELESFYARWGGEILIDPGYNSHWSPLGKPFEGLREPGKRLIATYLERSASANPWQVTPVPSRPPVTTRP